MAFASCETYKVADPEVTAVAPLDGHYICLAFKNASDAAVDNWQKADEYLRIYTSATTENASDEIWVNVMNELCMYPYVHNVCVKAKCDPKALTFGTNGQIKSTIPSTQAKSWILGGAYYTSYGASKDSGIHDVTISNGKLVIDGWDTPSGYKSDYISFEYTCDGETYYVVGARYTGWEEDYEYITSFCEEY